MTAAPAKFTFDLDLRDRPEPTSFISDEAAAALQRQARNEGLAQGRTEGERSTTSAAAQARTAAVETIAQRVATLLGDLDTVRGAARRDAVELAAVIGRKLSAALLARQPAAELEALLVDCLASLDGVPHLVIRCHPDLTDEIRDLATARISTSGFSGRLIVMGDPDLKLGDGRIEWVDGGLVRDTAAISAEIDERIATYLAARAANNKGEHA